MLPHAVPAFPLSKTAVHTPVNGGAVSVDPVMSL